MGLGKLQTAWRRLKGRRIRASKMYPSAATRRAALTTVEGLEHRQLLSTTWFVAPSGSNNNPGSLTSPFQTIQAAANVAQPGDKVEIEAGTYRETVTPKHSGTSSSPITYEAYNGQNVTVSGADAITGWTSAGNNVYYAPMSWDLGEGNNEVFVDGVAINEARWPNTSLDLSHPTLEKATSVSRSGNSITIYDSALNQSSNYWKGATIHLTAGEQWEAQTGTVTSSSPGQITFSFSVSSSWETPRAGNAFYLTGTFKALDTTNEWYRDPSNGRLYVDLGSNPSGHTIEAKHRNDAFDLSGQSYITIQNVTVYSATIETDSKSNNTTLNQIKARYISQFLPSTKAWSAPDNSGIELNGDNSVLENSIVTYSAGDGVYVKGRNSRITNNVISEIDYSATDTAGVRVYGSGTEIDHNTIFNTGRDGILHQAPHLQILNNTLHDIGLQTTEAGGIYTVKTDGGGTVIAYNTISNMHSGGYGETALFLDNYSNNYVVHHNITSNVDTAFKANFTSRGNNVYNNTLGATEHSIDWNYQGDWNGTTFSNNVTPMSTNYGKGATQKGDTKSVGSGVGAGSITSGASNELVHIVTSGSPSSGGSNGGSNSNSGSTSSNSGSNSSSSGSTSSGGSHSSSSGGTTTGSKTPTSTPTTPAPTTGTPNPTPPTTPDPTPPAVDNSIVTAPYPKFNTVSDLTQMVADDRTALTNAINQRQATLDQLAATKQNDQLALDAARQQLAAARRVTPAKAGVASRATVSTLATQVKQLRDALKADIAALHASRHSDFTGVHDAQQKLIDDIRALKIGIRYQRKVKG